MSHPQVPHRPFFHFGNPFQMISPKGSQMTPNLSALLNTFEETFAGRLRKLNPKDNNDVLSLSWMKLAMESLCGTKELLDEMKSFGIKPDTVVYTTLIDCYCRTGRVDEAIELLKEMKERRCKADTVTFNVILGRLCREGRIEDALEMLDKLPYEGIYLNKGSYRIVLNSLCQKGELNKAKELLRLMMGRGFVPHYATSNELLVSLCEAGMADDATMVLFGLVELGFKPLPDSWALFVESICRERKLLPAFELLDELVNEEFD